MAVLSVPVTCILCVAAFLISQTHPSLFCVGHEDSTATSADPSVCFRIIILTSVQYQLALHQIDSLRKDGKFLGVDGTIPEGQGIVMAHLSECHELVQMVRDTKSLFLITSLIFPVTAQRIHGGS